MDNRDYYIKALEDRTSLKLSDRDKYVFEYAFKMGYVEWEMTEQ